MKHKMLLFMAIGGAATALSCISAGRVVARARASNSATRSAEAPIDPPNDDGPPTTIDRTATTTTDHHDRRLATADLGDDDRRGRPDNNAHTRRPVVISDPTTASPQGFQILRSPAEDKPSLFASAR